MIGVQMGENKKASSLPLLMSPAEMSLNSHYHLLQALADSGAE